MARSKTWRKFSGTELAEWRENESSIPLEDSPAIYLWRRVIKPPQSCLDREENFLEWLSKILNTPNALIPDSQLNHCAQIKELRVGGGSLSKEKNETLPFFSNNFGRRRTLGKYLESLNKFFPPIYVGHTNHLKKRVTEHLDGKTELLEYIKGLGLTVNDIGIEYLHFESLDKPQLELLEMIAQLTLSPFGTKRIG